MPTTPKVTDANREVMLKKDQTDWKRVGDAAQADIDRKAKEDEENPILSKASFHKFKKK